MSQQLTHGDVRMFYNSDMSGDVTIFKRSTKEEININGRDLLTVIAWWVGNERISDIEQQEPWETLGVKPWERES